MAYMWRLEAKLWRKSQSFSSVMQMLRLERRHQGRKRISDVLCLCLDCETVLSRPRAPLSLKPSHTGVRKRMLGNAGVRAANPRDTDGSVPLPCSCPDEEEGIFLEAEERRMAEARTMKLRDFQGKRGQYHGQVLLVTHGSTSSFCPFTRFHAYTIRFTHS